MASLHYADLLSITDGRLVSFKGVEGLYEVFNSISGPGVTTIAMLYLQDPVSKHITSKYPELLNLNIKLAIDKAIKAFEKFEKNPKNIKPYIEKYVKPLVSQEYFEVEPMDSTVQENLLNGYSDWLKKTLGDKQVIAVEVDNGEQHQ